MKHLFIVHGSSRSMEPKLIAPIVEEMGAASIDHNSVRKRSFGEHTNEHLSHYGNALEAAQRIGIKAKRITSNDIISCFKDGFDTVVVYGESLRSMHLFYTDIGITQKDVTEIEFKSVNHLKKKIQKTLKSKLPKKSLTDHLRSMATKLRPNKNLEPQNPTL